VLRPVREENIQEQPSHALRLKQTALLKSIGGDKVSTKPRIASARRSHPDLSG
jgi:hypothetical protein